MQPPAMPLGQQIIIRARLPQEGEVHPGFMPEVLAMALVMALMRRQHLRDDREAVNQAHEAEFRDFHLHNLGAMVA
ncbi:hypothetical protein D3C78_1664820 [compost metagenome]